MTPPNSLLKGVLIATLGTWVVYVIAANGLLMTGALESAINRQPERLQLLVTKARTPFPGLILVDGLDLRTQSDTLQMNIIVDEASIWLNPVALLSRELHIPRARGEGGVIKMASRQEPGSKPVTAAPSIRGLNNPPNPDPEVIYPAPDPMEVSLGDIRIEGFRELWINSAHFQGKGALAGGLDALPRERIGTESLTWTLTEGMVTLNNAMAAKDLKGELRLSLEPVLLKTSTLESVFDGFSGQVDIEGSIANPRFLNRYLRGVAWLTLDGSEGPVSAHLGFTKGVLDPGSRLSVKPKEVTAQLAGFDIQGPGEVLLDVDGSEPPRGRLEVSMGEYTIRNSLREGDWVVGEGVTLRASTSALFIPAGFDPLDLELTLPPATAPRLSLFNAYLPRDLGVGLVGGKGTVEGQFKASTESLKGKGTMSVKASNILMAVDELKIRGNGDLSLAIKVPDISKGRFEIGGSTIALKGVTLIDESGASQDVDEPWWGNAQFDGGHIKVGVPIFLDAHGSAQLKDSRPLVTAFASNKDLPRWSHNLLTRENITATFAFAVGDDIFILEPLSVKGEDFSLEARMNRRGTSNQGALLIKSRGLSAGVALKGGGRSVTLLKAEEWYQSRPVLGDRP